MLSSMKGIKILAVAVVVWGVSNWALDSDPMEHETAIAHQSTNTTVDQKTVMPLAPAVATPTAAIPQPLVTILAAESPQAISARSIANLTLTEVNINALTKAMEAATTTLKMAAKTLQLAVDHHAEITALTRQAQPAMQPPPALASTAAPPRSSTTTAVEPADPSPGGATLLAEADEVHYLLAQARQAAWHGNDKEALRFFRKVALLSSHNSTIQGEFGNLLYRMGHWPEAVKQFVTASELHFAAGEYQRVVDMLPVIRQLAPAKAMELRQQLHQDSSR